MNEQQYVVGYNVSCTSGNFVTVVKVRYDGEDPDALIRSIVREIRKSHFANHMISPNPSNIHIYLLTLVSSKPVADE